MLLGIGTRGRLCEHCSDVLDSLDRWEFPHQLSDYWLMKQGTVISSFKVLCGRLNVSLPYGVQTGTGAHPSSWTAGAKTFTK
jgi:hypothetical protein